MSYSQYRQNTQYGDEELPPPWYARDPPARVALQLTSRIRQYDDAYKTFYYVNPTTNPPTTSWTRPGFPEGQAAPEQTQVYDYARNQGRTGSAAEYLNSAPAPGHNSGAGAYGYDNSGTRSNVGGLCC